jgi:hypothetical protein
MVTDVSEEHALSFWAEVGSSLNRFGFKAGREASDQLDTREHEETLRSFRPAGTKTREFFRPTEKNNQVWKPRRIHRVTVCLKVTWSIHIPLKM